MSGPIRFVRQGGSLPFAFDRNGEPTDGWICTIYVKQFKDDPAIISRVIPLDENKEWSSYLTSTETDTLTPGTLYRIAGILTSAANVEEEQVPIRFQLNDSWN